MILAWVISLILLCTSLISYLERLSALRIIEVNTMQLAQKNFMKAEQSILECEKNMTNLTHLKENTCFIQSRGKNYWLITSKDKPAIQIGVVIDENTGIVSRINWRQVFE